ncbi:MAG TPA: biopolymer transporter ExbD [Nitrospirota bacterium]|nr:biopolymer transporter ExbD [Nitrospirota bacterium]
MASDLFSSNNDTNDEPISSINVTPFVDVVLVLLVIFMVTAPLLMQDSIGIRLPKAMSSDRQLTSKLGVAVTRQGQILLNGVLASPEAITARVRESLANDPETQALISADGDARHADVVRAIDLVKSAGISRFAIQIEKQ